VECVESYATRDIAALGGPTTILLAPPMIAKLLTRPGAVNMATRALKTNVNTAAGRALAYRLAAALGLSPPESSKIPKRLQRYPRQYVKPHTEGAPMTIERKHTWFKRSSSR